MFRRKRTPPSQEERAPQPPPQAQAPPAAAAAAAAHLHSPHHHQSPHHFPPGALLANGRYRVRRLLNRGGSAVVYEADDVSPEASAPPPQSPSPSPSLVALKCHDLTQCDPRSLDRLKREILNAKDFLRHENVVRLLNVALQHDCLVLALELVDGADLLEVINRAGGRLHENRARHYFAQVLHPTQEQEGGRKTH